MQTPVGQDIVPLDELEQHVRFIPADQKRRAEIEGAGGKVPKIFCTIPVERDMMSPEAREFLEGADVYEYTHHTCLNAEQMAALLGNPDRQDIDQVLCFMEPITEGNWRSDMPESARHVASAAMGFDNKSVAVAKETGRTYTNAPGTLFDDVAETAVVLTLTSLLRYDANTTMVKAGSQVGCSMYDGRHPGMYNYTLENGIRVGHIGGGETGSATMRRLIPFVYRADGKGSIVYSDPVEYPEKEAALNGLVEANIRARVLEGKGDPNAPVEFDPIHCVSFDELITTSDVIFVQCPLTKDEPPKGTRHLINMEILEKIRNAGRKPFIVNTARGPIVDEEAIAVALRGGWIAGYVTDVAENESARPTHLYDAAREGGTLYVNTAHTASNTANRNNMVNRAVLNLRSLWLGEGPLNPVG